MNTTVSTNTTKAFNQSEYGHSWGKKLKVPSGAFVLWEWSICVFNALKKDVIILVVNGEQLITQFVHHPIIYN